MGCQQWATVDEFLPSVGQGISCKIKNLSNSRNSTTKNFSENGEQFGVQLLQKTHKINEHEVEIQSPVLDIVNSEESLTNLDSYKVLVGSEKWAIENGIAVSDSVNAALAHERATGNISILIGVNGL